MNNTTATGKCYNGFWLLNGQITVLEVIIQPCIQVLSLVLNIILLRTICCSSRLRTHTHVFIASLAGSDAIFSTSGLIYVAVLVYGKNVCFPQETISYLDRSLYVSQVFITFSIYINISFVSVERWLYIARPYLHQRIVSSKTTYGAVAAGWLAPFLVAMDGWILPADLNHKVEQFKLNSLYPILHFLVSIFLFGIYTHLTFIIRRQLRAINKQKSAISANMGRQLEHVQPVEQKLRSLMENLRSTRLLLTVFGAFFFLLTPGACFHVIENFKSVHIEHHLTHEALKVLNYFHGSVNFVVFASQDRQFRSLLVGSVHKLCRRGKCTLVYCTVCHQRIRPVGGLENRTGTTLVSREV